VADAHEITTMTIKTLTAFRLGRNKPRVIHPTVKLPTIYWQTLD